VAITVSYAARYAVPPAGNADLNPVNSNLEPAFNILISSSDGNGAVGDLHLSNPDDAGTLDSNTWVSIDGGVNWYNFDVLFYGVLDPNNTGNYDFTSSGGPNFVGPNVLSLQLDDGLGTRVFFFPEESYSLSELNLLPHGGVNVVYDDLGPPPPPPPVCFVGGTLIEANKTQVTIEMLKIGDLVKTKDNGTQTVSWVGKRIMPSDTLEHLLPIRLKAGALGENLPKRDLLVSPQHRVLLNDWRAELLFGQQEVLVAAKHLVNDTDIRVATDLEEFEYFHIMFDSHQTIFSEGLPTESFHPGDMAMKSLSEESRAEVLELFPELAENTASYGPSTHVTLKAFEAEALNAI